MANKSALRRERLWKALLAVPVLLACCAVTCGQLGVIDHARDLIAGPSEPGLHSRIRDYCEAHEEVRLSDVTDFDWDIAYVDREPYGDEKKLREKYGIVGVLEEFETDALSRIAFCRDGELVYDLVLNYSYFEVASSVEIIYPDSVFRVTQIPLEYKEKKLFLSPK
ncbi:MAG: hypothetical protein FWE94_04835 [Coriobacteriia bacterium]|nr:hypothetical protein [Coriobacteriia bacterium]